MYNSYVMLWFILDKIALTKVFIFYIKNLSELSMYKAKKNFKAGLLNDGHFIFLHSIEGSEKIC